MSRPNKPTKPLRKHWSQVAQNALLGKTITGISYATKAQLDKLDVDMMGESILLITFSDHTTWTVAADDEFNAPGALHLVLAPKNKIPAETILPVVPADE